MPIHIPIPPTPDLTGYIDQDILNDFNTGAMLYGDIINIQLIRTNKELIAELRKKEKKDQHDN